MSFVRVKINLQQSGGMELICERDEDENNVTLCDRTKKWEPHVAHDYQENNSGTLNYVATSQQDFTLHRFQAIKY